MKKNKIILLLLMVFTIISISGCGKKEAKKEEVKKNEDAIKFKEEYETLNGQTNARGIEHRTVSISSDNPYVYQTADEIVERINNKETFYVYFGDTQCPWCRSNVEMAIKQAKKYNIDTIYYVKIWDDNHNEILRDKLSINEDGEVVVDSEGTESYYKLLELLDSVLSDYTLSDEVEPTEKRIYAPNYIYIENGKPVLLVEGISEDQEDARGEWTDKILKDEEEAFEKLFNR